MKKTYQTSAASAVTEEFVMPESVTLAMADLAETMKEGLLALAVGAGFGVMEDAGGGCRHRRRVPAGDLPRTCELARQRG